MNEIIINGANSGVYQIDLDKSEDRATWERILLDDSARAGPGSECRFTVQAGNLVLYHLRNGRGVGSKDNPHILFQPSVDPAVWAGLCGVSGDPVRCPFCRGIPAPRFRGTWKGVLTAAYNPKVSNDLDEYRCECSTCGRSFWI